VYQGRNQIAVVKKLREKSPLNYMLVCNVECLNPLKINEDSSASVDKLTKCLEVLCDVGRIKQVKRDRIITE